MIWEKHPKPSLLKDIRKFKEYKKMMTVSNYSDVWTNYTSSRVRPEAFSDLKQFRLVPRVVVYQHKPAVRGNITNHSNTRKYTNDPKAIPLATKLRVCGRKLNHAKEPDESLQSPNNEVNNRDSVAVTQRNAKQQGESEPENSVRADNVNACLTSFVRVKDWLDQNPV